MLKKLIQKTALSSDKDKKILYICRVSGKCKDLIALLQWRTDIDVDAAKYVSIHTKAPAHNSIEYVLIGEALLFTL